MKISYFQVFGERNSGTNYLVSLVRKNYPNVKVTNRYGWKHSDLGSIYKYYKKDQPDTILSSRVNPLHGFQFEHTLFAVIVRNPFTWLQSMHRSPHHAPKSRGLNFHSFINTPWESYYSEPGQAGSPDISYRNKIINKKNLFEQYESVIKMRSAKLEMHHTIKDRVKNFFVINYEYLAINPDKVMKEISTIYGIEQNSKFENELMDKSGEVAYKKKKYSSIKKDDIVQIRNELDWKMEKKFGYEISKSKYNQFVEQKKLKNFLIHPLSVNQISSPADILDMKLGLYCYHDGKLIS